MIGVRRKNGCLIIDDALHKCCAQIANENDENAHIWGFGDLLSPLAQANTNMNAISPITLRFHLPC
jgi:hypothetical protein